jgi:dynein light chain 1
LSLARNSLTRIEGLEPVAATLQQLWLSYNQISKLEGLKALPQLKVLYLANNLLRDVNETANLPPSLEELSLVGCPLFEAARGDKGENNPLQPGCAYRLEVLRRVQSLRKLDGVPVDAEEMEAARNKTPGTASAGMPSGLGETSKPAASIKK